MPRDAAAAAAAWAAAAEEATRADAALVRAMDGWVGMVAVSSAPRTALSLCVCMCM